MDFEISSTEKKKLINQLANKLIEYLEGVHCTKISTELSNLKIKNIVSKEFPSTGLNYQNKTYEILDDIALCSLHISNPSYFGLFTPATLFSGVLADIITAVYNPNLGSWDHAPYFVEVESYLIEMLCKKFGYSSQGFDGVFTSGAAEGNIYAVLCALKGGLMLSSKVPKSNLLVYCSAESHHSIEKATRVVGMGIISTKRIPTDCELEMRIDILEEQIQKDLSLKYSPLMVIGTAGTTGAGGLDNLQKLSALCKRYGLWFHVDAAYGGALIFNDSYKKYVTGIELSDSISFDFHKWLAAPVGTSIFLTSNPKILHQLFSIDAGYMPEKANRAVDPYSHSLNWSRRPIGFRVYLSLRLYGWDGYSKLVENQIAIGKYFSEHLRKSGWLILNNSILPIICFTHPIIQHNSDAIQNICNSVVNSGEAWISTYKIKGFKVFRACIINLYTTEKEVSKLLGVMNNEIKRFDNVA